MDVLHTEKLTKRFGKFTAVDNISFSLLEGEILGLLGPNGAGKTTIVQMLLGILTPSAGEVVVFGKNLKHHRGEIMEHVGFSSTYTNLPWNLTVKENLTFVSYLYDIEDRKEQLQRIVEIFRLNDFLSSKISNLSAGELTAVNLAKAFINSPKVLVLDEPTASLDPEVAKHIRNLLLQEREKFQVSIVLTSHNMAEIEEVCDRVVFVDHGKMIADDTPESLARSIKISHVELLIRGGLERMFKYCEEKNLPYKLKKRSIVVDVDEQTIPEFLKDLVQKGIVYDEINIEKATLEDYFLQVAKRSFSEKL